MKTIVNKNILKNAKSVGNIGNYFSRLLVLVTIFIIFSLISSRFCSFQNVINVLRNASLYALLSYGMTLTMITEGLDLSVGSVVAFSSCIGAMFILQGNIVLGVLIALVVGILCGMVNGIFISLFKIPPFIMTYGMMRIARGLALVVTGGLSIYDFPENFRKIGTGFFFSMPIPVIIAFLVGIFLIFFTQFTVIGRSIYSVGDNRTAAKFSGLKVNKIVFLSYALSGLLSGLVGIIYIARINAAEPVIGEDFPLFAIAASVIGGTPFFFFFGGIGGTIIGALIIAVLNNGLNILGLSSHWQVFLNGFIIIMAVIIDLFFRSRSRELKYT